MIDNIDDMLDWEKIDPKNPEIDLSYTKMLEDNKHLKDILHRFENGESSLGYEEIEKYKTMVEFSLKTNEMVIELLERIISMREIM